MLVTIGLIYLAFAALSGLAWVRAAGHLFRPPPHRGRSHHPTSHNRKAH